MENRTAESPPRPLASWGRSLRERLSRGPSGASPLSGGRRKSRKQGTSPRRPGVGFLARMLLAFTLTLVVLSLLQYQLASTDIEERLVEDSAALNRSDVSTLKRAFGKDRQAGGGLWAEVSERLQDIAARPGVGSAVLVSGYQEVVASSDQAGVGSKQVSDNVLQVMQSGRSYAGKQQDRGEVAATPYEYVTPVNLAIGRFALEVNKKELVLGQQLADARLRVIRVAALQLLVGFPLLYLLGGRSLSARHRAALEGSRRDPLTNLGNHRAFHEEIERAVGAAARHKQPLSLALIDVDDFKLVNDRFGHRHGDGVLTDIARSITGGRVEDLAFRIGGDEFALIMPHTQLDSAVRAVERMRLAAQELGSGITLSSGVAAVIPGNELSEYLQGHADAALYEAKRRGRNVLVRFDDIEEIVAITDPGKIRACRTLLDEGGLRAVFQPIWDLDRNEVLGYEALTRLPDGCELSGPGEAFEVAELMGRAHVLDALCRHAILARVSDLPAGALLFLNVSPQTLDHDTLTGDLLKQEVEAVGLSPNQVVLEITERSQARLEVVIREARRARDLGFRLALDDVGAGNAGLEMLRQLPVDFVKIDREVVTNAVLDIKSRAVLGAIISFARQTGAFVIAEGIETEAMISIARAPMEYDMTRHVGVHGAQGYLLGVPSCDLEAPPASVIRTLVT
jgi:diguanylate cyclase (GGDEF)-like protein